LFWIAGSWELLRWNLKLLEIGDSLVWNECDLSFYLDGSLVEFRVLDDLLEILYEEMIMMAEQTAASIIECSTVKNAAFVGASFNKSPEIFWKYMNLDLINFLLYWSIDRPIYDWSNSKVQVDQ
jgi:hypothetical protein